MAETDTKTKTRKPRAPKSDTAPRGRGRPRPQDVIDRDELILSKLTQPRTKQDIADETGIKPGIVYLSLWRLRREERVRRVTSDDGDVTRLWEVVG